MAGILYSSGKNEGVEATGVYRGILMEDMIDTVRRVKKPFIDVYVEDLFFDNADYPLTYVPMFNMVLPLKKDQEVWVQFNQQNHRYPVLWKLADNLDDNYTDEQVDLPSPGTLVEIPGAEATTEVLKISDDIWFIATASYGVLKWGEQCVLLNGNCLLMNAQAFGVKAGNLEFSLKDGKAASKGMATPKANGFLCALPQCLWSGAIHTG